MATIQKKIHEVQNITAACVMGNKIRFNAKLNQYCFVCFIFNTMRQKYHIFDPTILNFLNLSEGSFFVRLVPVVYVIQNEYNSFLSIQCIAMYNSPSNIP